MNIRLFGWSIMSMVLVALAITSPVAASSGSGRGVLPMGEPAVRAYRVLHAKLPGGGAVTSIVSLCNNEELTDDPTFVCGELPDTMTNRVTTQFTGRPAGETWALELYGPNTCDDRAQRVATLAPIRVGSNGRRTGRVALTQAEAGRIETVFGSGLALRLTRAGYHACVRYEEELLDPPGG